MINRACPKCYNYPMAVSKVPSKFGRYKVTCLGQCGWEDNDMETFNDESYAKYRLSELKKAHTRLISAKQQLRAVKDDVKYFSKLLGIEEEEPAHA